MSTLTSIILASLATSIISFAGIILLVLSEARVKKLLHTALSFAVGGLLGAVFLDILPEALEMSSSEIIFRYVIGGIFFFFIFEKLLIWYHHHEDGGVPHEHVPAYLVSIGDLVHNAIDGIAIAVSFMVNIEVGIATTIAVLIHEVPSEIGDFLVMLNSGFTPKRAIFINFLVSLSSIVFAVATYMLGPVLEPYLPIALALVAGNFLYIAIADLMPQLQERRGWHHTLTEIVLLIAGALLAGAGHFLK